MIDLKKSSGDIDIFAGDDWASGDITAEDASGSSVDLSTGYTAKMEVRAAVGETAQITLTESDGITLASGSYSIAITAAQSGGVTAGTYLYDLRISLTGTPDEVITVRHGKVFVKDPITELS